MESDMTGLKLVTLVIRTVGELSEDACRAAILAQGVEAAQLITVREAPFTRAMQTGFEAGIGAGRPWTFCIDADVILRPGAIVAMLSHAERQSPEVFEVQGRALDKLAISVREVGNHFFRTALLPKMIDAIPEEGTALQPEHAAMQRMSAEGHPWVCVPHVVGLHDFGQYNRDIFRKCFIHAHKHLRWLPDLVPKLRSRATTDPDFAVALEGLAEGIRSSDDVRIDVQHRPIAQRFEDLGLVEKDPASSRSIEPGDVEDILREWAAAPDIRVRGLPVTAAEAIAMDGETRFDRLE